MLGRSPPSGLRPQACSALQPRRLLEMDIFQPWSFFSSHNGFAWWSAASEEMPTQASTFSCGMRSCGGWVTNWGSVWCKSLIKHACLWFCLHTIIMCLAFHVKISYSCWIIWKTDRPMKNGLVRRFWQFILIQLATFPRIAKVNASKKYVGFV